MVARRVETCTLDCSQTTAMKVVSDGMPAAAASSLPLMVVELSMTDVVVRERKASKVRA